MPRPTDLPNLNLSASIRNVSELDDGFPALSPRSAGSRTPRSAPSSPRLPSINVPTIPRQMNAPTKAESTIQGNGQASPRITAMPELPPSPTSHQPPQKHGREPSKSFFSNLMASKSSHRLHVSETSLPETAEKASARSRASSKDRSLHSVRRQGSTPELPRYNVPSSQQSHDSMTSTNTQEMGQIPGPASKKSKSKLGGMLVRTKTLRGEENAKQRAPAPSSIKTDTSAASNDGIDHPPKTAPLAPLKSDHRARAFGGSNGNTPRNRSADRSIQEVPKPIKKENRQTQHVPASHSFQGTTLLSNIQQTGKGVGDRLKAGKGWLGKITRSGSSVEREPLHPEEHILRTINLPLVKQTRRTRIARRLELSKDKTEFWMPALPWRCIDYLNMNGCEEEGLYRIPGSGKDVKYWQRRFDMELDINLFEEPDLHDINTIGSMFKSWLRELPDEILPKAVQNKVAQQCQGATTVPQLFKDELSRLPPFNYYLLFAITCHLSLLTSFSDKNKMDYRNLCICFQPCLKIDAFCFQFLVNDWKSCWQGCYTEKEYLEDEYRYEREGSINESEDLAVDDRAVSSSGSSQTQPPPQHSQQGQALPEPPPSATVSTPRDETPKPTGLRKSPSKKHKPRSASQNEIRKSSSNSGHVPANSAPSVPRVVTTPEPQKVPAPDKLPEVMGLSPIRM